MSSDTTAQESATAGAGVTPAEAAPQVAPENSIAASAPVPAVPAAPSSAPDGASAAVPAKTEAQANVQVDAKATEPSATESSIAASAPVANVPAPSNSTPAEASGATPVKADAKATEASATEMPPQAATTSSGDVEMKTESQTEASETQTTSEGNKPSDASETPKRDEAAPFEPVDDGTDDFTTRSKKRYVIMMGYSGIGYKGLQINKDEETIEKALEEAIVASGVIKEENAGDLKKSNWSRAARTDKGVHAVGQTISLKMGLKDHPRHIQAFIEAVNAKLPDQIKVFNVLRTTKSFNCKLQCNGRKYEYLLPVYLFRPRPFKKQDTNAAPAASDASPAVAKEVSVEGASKPATEDGPELATKPISREEKQALFFQNFRKESIEMTPDMPADALERLKTVLNLYVGTRNYHNFTPKMAFNNGAAKRYITAIEVDGPFTIKGTKVIRVTLEGQSFVLNQIRKMIGTAVEVVRRGLDPSILEAFFENIKLPTPMIPGEGLALRACLFTPYNNRYGGGEVPGAVSSAANPRYNSIDFDHEPVKSRADAFRETILYPTMVEQDEKNSVWAKYIYNQDSAVFPPVAQVAEPEGPEAAAKRAKEKNELAKRRRRDGDPNGPGKNKRSRTGNSGGAPRGQGARGGRGGHGRGNGVMDEVKSFLSSNKY